MSVQTISQKRAKHALAAVRQWVNDKKSKDQKELKSYALGFPAMILMSGFGQTCAFYRSKGGNHELQFNVLADWLTMENIFPSNDLMKEIVDCDASRYQLAEAESLAYLNWLKKFARAYLQEESNESAAV